jgi:DNA-binding transcriptional regulator YiaG
MKATRATAVQGVSVMGAAQIWLRKNTAAPKMQPADIKRIRRESSIIAEAFSVAHNRAFTTATSQIFARPSIGQFADL